MATLKLGIPSELRAVIARLHPETKRKVRAAFDAIARDPTIGEPLERELSGYRKIALGPWRVVYRQERRHIEIHAIGRRATVYSQLLERLDRRGSKRRRRRG